jgi:3-hydroxyisobutyrate dehydrogenase-like beta-hydroxyacid dehydrogenase
MARALLLPRRRHGTKRQESTMKVGFIGLGRMGTGMAGSLISAAGPQGDINWCAPVLEALGRGVIRLGESAKAANVVKRAGNLLNASMSEALGEAFALTRKAGVEPDAFLEVFVSAFAWSPAFEGNARLIARGAYEPAGLKARLVLNDLRLALAAGDASGVPMPLASVVHDSLLAAVAQGKGEQDYRGLRGHARRY